MSRFAAHPRRRTGGRAIAAVMTLGFLLGGCSDSSPEAAPPEQTASPSPSPSPSASGAETGAATAAPTATTSPAPSPPAEAEAGAPEGNAQGEALLQALRDGGNIIYIRHAATEATDDAAIVDLDDPSTQRNLSEEGRRQAELIGAGFEELDIPVGEVVSSPYFRAVETAQIAFGEDAIATDMDLVYPYYQGVDRGALARSLREMLDLEPDPGTNTVIVGHGDNLVGAAQVQVEMGTAAVIDPAGSAPFEMIGTIAPEQWSELDS